MPSMAYLAKVYLLGKAVGPYYYIVVLLLFTLATPGLIRLVETKSGRIIAYGISVATLIFAYVLQMRGHNVWDYLKYTIVWLPFFLLGMYARRRPIVRLGKITCIVLIIITYILQIVETVILSQCVNTEMIAYSQIRISAFLYDAAIAITILNSMDTEVQQTKINKFFITLGNASFFVFLVHIGFIYILNKIAYLDIIPLFLTHVIQVTVTIIGSLIIYKVINMLPVRFKKLLGA